MNDPYRLTDAPHHHGGNLPSATRTPGVAGDRGTTLPSATRTPGAAGDRGTTLLWVALALCAALNAVFSVASPGNLLPSLAFGVAALGCIGLLVARYLGRRQP
ncbi:hypothetical protein [Ornithinimicrobium murale]|uniref:hypothetical protein n=1 Tax=Ornithinimicrobium murale TaxID=1050153 RepID=UPI000E0DC4F1|nr:hypothetical protein [Ornithinimicrobium murale]